MKKFLQSLLNRAALQSMPVAVPHVAPVRLPVDPILDIKIQIPGGELVTFERGGDLYHSIPFVDGDQWWDGESDQMGYVDLYYRPFADGHSAKSERPDRWGAALACALTGHGRTSRPKVVDSKTFWHEGCACGRSVVPGTGGELPNLPLMELAIQFAKRQMWMDVESVNEAIIALAANFATGNVDFGLITLHSTLKIRDAFNGKLAKIIKEEGHLAWQAERAAKSVA